MDSMTPSSLPDVSRHPARTVTRPPMRFQERIYLIEIWRGLWITTRHLVVNLWRHFRKAVGMPSVPGAVTVQYPEDPAVVAKRSRTLHRLLKREDGTPRCVACMLCETVCPAKCIQIVAESSPDVMIEKRPKSFEINLGMCVYCGYCVEVCPEDAIRMDTRIVETSSYSRKDMVWNLAELTGDKKKGGSNG